MRIPYFLRRKVFGMFQVNRMSLTHHGIILLMLFVLGCGGLLPLHKAEEADVVPPVLLSQDPLVYPQEAFARGLEGNVRLLVLVSESGDVLKTRIEKSSRSPILDQAALEHAQTLKFRPALKNGKPYTVWTSFDIKYRLAEEKFKNLVLYADALADLYEQAEKAPEPVKAKLATRSFRLLEQFLLKNNVNAEQFNEVIKLFVQPEVYRDWRSFEKDWPFRFLIFHDFIQRFPQADESREARQTLFSLLDLDIDKIENRAFLNHLKSWLADQYPAAEFKKIVEKLEKRLEKLER